jgi:hypothetical protein
LSHPPSSRNQIKSDIESQNLPCRQGLTCSYDKHIKIFSLGHN